MLQYENFTENLKIVVTGAGGFIASTLVKKLIDLGASVLAIDLNKNRLTGYEHQNLDFKTINLMDANEVNATISEYSPHIIYHLACHPDSKETYEHILKGPNQNILTINLLNAFSQCETRKLFVYGSTCKVYGNSEVPYHSDMKVDPLSSYAIAKFSDSKYTKLFGELHNFKTATVQPTLTYGPNQAFNLFTYVIESVLQNKKSIPIMGGEQTRDPIYIDDLVSLFITLIDNMENLTHNIVNVGGNNEQKVVDIVANILEKMNSDIPIEINNQAARFTDMLRNFSDNREAKELFNWEAKTSLDTGIQNTIDYIKNLT